MVTVPANENMTLRPNAIGVLRNMFQAWASTGAAPGIATGLVFAALYAGGSTPLAILIGGAICVLLAITIGQLAKHITSAGGLYAYSARALGGDAGFLVSWIYTFGTALIVPLEALVVGYIAQADLTADFGWPHWVWAPIMVASAGLVWYISYRGVKVSTTVSLVLGSIEILVFGVLIVMLIVKAGGHNTIAVFGLQTGNAHGLGSVIAGGIFVILGFIGFESGTTLSEETSNPHKNVPSAILFVIIAMTAFYVLAYYAASVYFGPDKMSTFLQFNGGDPWTGMALVVWGPAAILVTLCVLEGAVGAANGNATAASRLLFAMSRARVLPAALGHVHPRHRTPSTAVGGLIVVSTVISLILGFALGSPENAFALIGTVLTLLVLVAYLMTAVSCTVFYLRERRSEFNPLLHLLTPLVVVIAFLLVLIASFGVNIFNLGISALAYPTDWAPWICLAWVLLGCGWLVYLRRSDPGRIARLGVAYAGVENESEKLAE